MCLVLSESKSASLHSLPSEQCGLHLNVVTRNRGCFIEANKCAISAAQAAVLPVEEAVLQSTNCTHSCCRHRPRRHVQVGVVHEPASRQLRIVHGTRRHD